MIRTLILIFLTPLLLSFGCSTVKEVKIDCSILNCRIIEIKEYQHSFRFMALNGNDTILIGSAKENYYDKYGVEKPVLNDLQEIKENEEYVFYLTKKRVSVGQMEQLGSFIIIAKDTLWRAPNYKEVPLSFISHSSIGKFHSKHIPKRAGVSFQFNKTTNSKWVYSI